MATHEFDCAWCGKHVVIEDYRGQPPKYCSEQCKKAVQVQNKRDFRKREKLKKAAFYSNRSDPSTYIWKPLVPVQRCAKCRYGLMVGRELCCGYFEIAGRTRLGLHPEGLTENCLEFRPRARARKKFPKMG